MCSLHKSLAQLSMLSLVQLPMISLAWLLKLSSALSPVSQVNSGKTRQAVPSSALHVARGLNSHAVPGPDPPSYLRPGSPNYPWVYHLVQTLKFSALLLPLTV